MANRPVPRALTRAQQARRQRVVDAAMALGLDGGYEAVQMPRCRRSGRRGHGSPSTAISPARTTCWPPPWCTGSSSWTADWPSCRRRATRPRSGSSTPWTGRSGRWAASRSWSSAVFTALASPDLAAIECQQQVSVLMEGIITRAIGEPHPPNPERSGPDPRPRLVLGPGRLGQRVEQHGAGARRAGRGHRPLVAEPTSTPRS